MIKKLKYYQEEDSATLQLQTSTPSIKLGQQFIWLIV